MLVLSLTVAVCFTNAVNAGKLIQLDKQKFFQGDIDIPVSNLRNGILKAQRWPDGKIPYMIVYDYKKESVEAIRKAMLEIETYTCIRFVNRTKERNYITITSSSGCSSGVGRSDGQRSLSLNEDGCIYHGIIIHELMHTIGLYHEMMRHDRDQYLYYYPDNVEEGSERNFNVKSADDTKVHDIPYNFLSVMHYSLAGFSKNGRFTLFPKRGVNFNLDNIGRRERGHELDYLKIRRIYECKGNYPKVPEPDLIPKEECKDEIPNCFDRIKNNEEYEIHECRKTLKVCGPNDYDSPCDNYIDNCHEFLDGCKTDVQTMAECKRACGLC